MGTLVSVLLKILYFLIVFGIIVLLAYYTTKIVGKRVSVNAGKYMQVIDNLYIGSDKSLIIIKVENSYLLLSCSNHGLELIKELDGFEEDLETGGSFKGYLEDYSIRKYKRLRFFRLFRKPKHGGDSEDD